MITYLLTCLLFGLLIFSGIRGNPKHLELFKSDKAPYVSSLVIVSLVWPLTVVIAILLKFYKKVNK